MTGLGLHGALGFNAWTAWRLIWSEGWFVWCLSGWKPHLKSQPETEKMLIIVPYLSELPIIYFNVIGLHYIYYNNRLRCLCARPLLSYEPFLEGYES